jgi:hypothetical protein
MNSIEVINKVNAKVIEIRLIQPVKLISLTEYSLQCVEHKLKIEIITLICNNEIDLERTHLCRVDTLIKEFKIWKSFIYDMKPSRPTGLLYCNQILQQNHIFVIIVICQSRKRTEASFQSSACLIVIEI